MPTKESNNNECCKNIVELFSKKKYLRDPPYQLWKLQERVLSSIQKNRPIPLIGFWGIGQKQQANSADQRTCEQFSQLRQDVQTVYPPGLKFTFIIALPHAIHNGISQETIKQYTKEMIMLFKKYDFDHIMLDKLWNKYNITFERIDDIVNILQQQKGWWEQVQSHELMEKNAIKRNKRVSPQKAAQFYYVMRNLEKKMLEQEFPDAIFHTFNSSSLANVLPDMPTIYLYIYDKVSHCPWFVEDER